MFALWGDWVIIHKISGIRNMGVVDAVLGSAPTAQTLAKNTSDHADRCVLAIASQSHGPVGLEIRGILVRVHEASYCFLFF
ncbi:MAG: hypothetical protein C4B59_16205 [Candidatus Methanogaster sp.]|uniref:Uncharacterized protein n=1 Tax=Candidatus Methanogaster sp. TaxID=3386292 RepID=A0AC61KYB9_9EURY|nr:MAG: hypothetical protein C4B59_16205 [ANME-2 cluster archaeon]